MVMVISPRLEAINGGGQGLLLSGLGSSSFLRLPPTTCGVNE